MEDEGRVDEREGVEVITELKEEDDVSGGVHDGVLGDSFSESGGVRGEGVGVSRSPTVIVGEDNPEHFALNVTGDSVEGEGTRREKGTPQYYNLDLDVSARVVIGEDGKTIMYACSKSCLSMYKEVSVVLNKTCITMEEKSLKMKVL